MDSQRIWILKYWVAVKEICNRLDLQTEYIFIVSELDYQLEMQRILLLVGASRP